MPRVGLDFNTILMTAVEIADHEGVEAITLATIARKLSVKPPSLFNHTSGLPSIKRALSLYGLSLLYKKINNAVMEKQQDEALFSMATAYLEFTREHPGLYQFTIQAPEKDDQELEIASNKLLQLISEVLYTFNIAEEMIIHKIRGLRSILHGFASLEQMGAFGLPVKTEESFEHLVSSYINSLNN
ncbi:TetR family transcriptional regulator [Ureibacillus massiliensis 4400831 = CIP 108448 = CCUG 49529]|uniref:TetR family transcriptional regulator n=2 Tax=cellular organisms TaxID=131567 RepID=A0A0A3JVE2_9BACL|nr:TetR-like C-terminal domain-containing protein [Ureibacillus massiliensis]KGR90977.1 TetR family transcriptional regulator [Ureibacillus massiliensis 4400831 = CIP 108448 = CCUG 49529]